MLSLLQILSMWSVSIKARKYIKQITPSNSSYVYWKGCLMWLGYRIQKPSLPAFWAWDNCKIEFTCFVTVNDIVAFMRSLLTAFIIKLTNHKVFSNGSCSNGNENYLIHYLIDYYLFLPQRHKFCMTLGMVAIKHFYYVWLPSTVHTWASLNI